MAVSQSKFVDITSGVGAATTIPQRLLILRLMTDNVLLPPQSYKEFSSLDEVGAYFGTASQEYLRAAYYFDWVSKNITQAPLISYGRWVDTAVAGVIYGARATYLLATLQAVTNGSLNLTIGANQHQLTGINLSGAGSLAAVAALLQTAIRAYSAGGADWTAATVAYNATPTQGGQPQFVLTGGVVGPEAMGIAAASVGTDIGPLVGWLSALAVIAQGSAVESLTNTMIETTGLSNNFGSFAFIPALNTTQVTELALWNDGNNVFYMFMVPVTAANAVTIMTAISVYAGCAVTLSPLSNDYPELIPAAVLAATRYDQINSVQDYMYQTGFPSTAAVTDDTDYDIYSALGVNFYLITQNAGQFESFYARGVLTGTATDPVDQNTYANEQWLKDALAAQLLTLLLALAQVSADNQGVAQITAILQSVILQALDNGTIVQGKPLDEVQILYVTNATGDNTAWKQVESLGYWLNVVIVPYVESSVTKYKAVYTLIYSKDDVIRFIQGSDILI